MEIWVPLSPDVAPPAGGGGRPVAYWPCQDFLEPKIAIGYRKLCTCALKFDSDASDLVCLTYILMISKFQNFKILKFWNFKILKGKSYVYLYTWVYIAEIVYLQVYIFGYVYL